MLLVLQKNVFIENEAVQQCVMRKMLWLQYVIKAFDKIFVL